MLLLRGVLKAVEEKGGALFQVVVFCEKLLRLLFTISVLTPGVFFACMNNLKVALVTAFPIGIRPILNFSNERNISPGVADTPTGRSSAGPKLWLGLRFEM